MRRNNVMKYLTIFLLLFLMSSCSRLSTQYFSIEVPRNWQSVEHTDNSVTLARKNRQNTTIHIVAARRPEGVTLEENWKDYYKFESSGKKIINQFEKEYNGVVWKGVTTDMIIRTVAMFTVKNNVRCIVLFSAEPSDFENNYEDFQLFMKNVNLKQIKGS